MIVRECINNREVILQRGSPQKFYGATFNCCSLVLKEGAAPFFYNGIFNDCTFTPDIRTEEGRPQWLRHMYGCIINGDSAANV